MAAITKKQICFLQTIRRQAGIDDETWLEMKRSVGVESTRELGWKQFDELKRRVEGQNRGTEDGRRRTEKSGGSWKPMHKSAVKSGMHHAPPKEKEAMIRKIEAILAELGLPWGYADSMARQMTGGRIRRLRFLDGDGTYKVLQALIIHQNRVKEAAV